MGTLIDALVLCGGHGSRVAHLLGDTPKFLTPLGNQRVCDHVISFLRAQPVANIVLSPGIQREKILAARLPVDAVDMWPKAEGTAEAVRRARHARFQNPVLKTDPILVVNGDTLLDVNLCRALDIYRASRMLAAKVYLRNPSNDLLHSGVRFLSQRALNELDASPHTDVDAFLTSFSTLSIEMIGKFLDVGTPDGLRFAWGPTIRSEGGCASRPYALPSHSG